MSKVTQMPGNSCLYYRRGRCLYEESLNPGYHAEWRCLVVKKWESDYDDFLCRAEAFNLGEEYAGRLWEKRFLNQLNFEHICDEYILGGDEEIPPCGNIQGDLCLIKIPQCEGICRLYIPRQ